MLPHGTYAQIVANTEQQSGPLGVNEIAEIESAIDAYLASTGRTIGDKSSEEYLAFLQEVLIDDHFQLNREQPNIGRYLLEKLDLSFDELTPTYYPNRVYLPLIFQNVPRTQLNQQQEVETNRSVNSVLAYNRDNVVSYANSYFSSPNRIYPEFGADCTNFASQAVSYGGYSQVGSGTCGIENNSTEWYASWGDFLCTSFDKNWYKYAASRSWTVVNDFRSYFRDKKGMFVEAYPATNEGFSLLISRLRKGDIVQLDVLISGKWAPTHAVVITGITGGTYYTRDTTLADHSGSPDWDTLRQLYASWNQKGVTSSRRLVWIKME